MEEGQSQRYLVGFWLDHSQLVLGNDCLSRHRVLFNQVSTVRQKKAIFALHLIEIDVACLKMLFNLSIGSQRIGNIKFNMMNARRQFLSNETVFEGFDFLYQFPRSERPQRNRPSFYTDKRQLNPDRAEMPVPLRIRVIPFPLN